MSRLDRLRSARWRVGLEALLVLLVWAGAGRLAYLEASRATVPAFLEWELRPAVMLACGHGFTVPGTSTPAAEAFVARQIPRVACGTFVSDAAPVDPLGIAQANRYSLYGAAAALRMFGPSWHVLDVYLGFVFGLSMVLIYGVGRLAGGPLVGAAAAIGLACSTVLGEILTVRDFMKLPCFAALWLALAWLIRAGLQRGAKGTLLPMAIGGITLGIGIGLRMDALIVLPVFLAVVAALPGFSWADLRMKAAASAAFLAAFFLVGWPILTALSSGSNSSHVVILGLTTPFDRALAIQPAPYDLGAQYADGFGIALTVTHGRYVQGEELPILYSSAKYDRVGRVFLRALATTFPADVATRALAATRQVFRYPFDARIQARVERMPVFEEVAWARRLVGWRNRVLAPFADREVAMVLFVLALACAFNWRLGVTGLAMALYFCGYSMLQFQRRHLFHLDALPILAALLAIWLPLLLAWRVGARFRESHAAGMAALRGYARELAIGVAALAAALLVGAAALASLRSWQQRHVTTMVSDVLARAWAPVGVTEEPAAATIMPGGQLLAAWGEIYRRDPDRWQTAVLFRIEGIVPVGTEADGAPDLRLRYFKVEMDGRCGLETVPIVSTYTGSLPTTDYEYTREWAVSVAPGRSSYVLTPGYSGLGPNWTRFDGFVVPAGARACVTGIEQVDAAKVPLPQLAVVLGPEWRGQRFYETLLDRPAVSSDMTPVAPSRDAVEGPTE